VDRLTKAQTLLALAADLLRQEAGARRGAEDFQPGDPPPTEMVDGADLLRQLEEATTIKLHPEQMQAGAARKR
jgi:hypothetical protein